MIKPQELYKWIQTRYEFYDQKEGKYCGEKYTKRVFKDAQIYFKLAEKEIEKLYNLAIAQNIISLNEKDKEIIKAINKFKDKENRIATELNNKKVKLNIKKIFKDKNKRNPLFVKFIENNKDTIFTAITDNKTKSLYTFKENDTWLFYEDDLIEII